MMAKQTLAKRLRETRQRQHMTLKQVEKLSGFSSTHISEIERGRTCPTITALVRIAAALSKDPCYFIEARELDECCLTRIKEGRAAGKPGRVEVQALSEGVLGGQLTCYLVRGEDDAQSRLSATFAGDLCFFALDGTISLTVGGSTYELAPGESLHVTHGEAPMVRVLVGPAELFVAHLPAAEEWTTRPPTAER